MPEPSYTCGDAKTPLLGVTIGQQFEAARKNWPDLPALVSCQENIRWTFDELGQQVDAMATGLIAIGLEPGDRVGIWSPNNAHWIVTQFATAKAGLILVNINPAYRLSAGILSEKSWLQMSCGSQVFQEK